MSGEQLRADKTAAKNNVTLTAKKASTETDTSVDIAEPLTVKALNQNTQKGNDNLVAEKTLRYAAPETEDQDTVLQLGGYNKITESNNSAYTFVQYFGVFASLLWLVYSAVYFIRAGTALDPVALGGALTAIFAPVALFWLCFAQFSRKHDVAIYAENLRSELEGLLFPSKTHATQVNKDIQLLCEQVADMNNNSRAALKSIQRARHGLRNEIRDFSSMASKAEFHIDRLGDVLENRKRGLLDSLDDIKTHENILKDHAQNGLDAWQSTQDEILSISQDVEDKMYKGSVRIEDAVNKASDKVANIDNQMDSVYQSMQSAVDNFGVRLDGISSDFDTHVEALSDSADRVSDETGKLGDNIRSEIDSLEDMTIKAIEAMAESSTSIEAQRRDLHNGVEKLSNEAQALSDRISDAADHMNGTVDLAVTRSQEIESRMDTQAERMNDLSLLLDDKASMIETSSDNMAAQLSEAMSVAVTGAEALRSAVRRAAEEMHKTMQDTEEKTDSLLSEIQVKFDNINDHTAHNVALIRKSANSFDDVIVNLDRSVTRGRDAISVHVNELDAQCEKLNAASITVKGQLENVLGDFDAPVSLLLNAGQDLENKQEQLAKTLGKRTEGIHAAGDRVHEQAEKIRGLLTGQVQELSSLAGELSGHTDGLEDRVRHQKDVLNEYLSDMIEKVNAHSGSVDEHLSHVKSTNEDIAINIGRFEEDMTDFTKLIDTKTQETRKSLGLLEDSYVDHWKQVESYGAKSAKRLQAAVETLKLSANETLPHYDEVLNKVDRAEIRFKELNTGFIDLSDDVLVRLQSLKDRIDESASSLHTTTKESAANLRVHEDSLRDVTEILNETSQDAEQKLKLVESRMTDQENNIRLIADKMEVRIDGLNETIGQQFIGLTESVGKAVAQLSDAASRFDVISSKVSQNAGESAAAITAANDKAVSNLDKLLEAGRYCTAESEKSIQILNKKTDKLLETTKDSRDAIARAGDGFVIRAREFEEYIKASLSTTKDYVVDLRTQTKAVAEVSDESADQIRESIMNVAREMKAITKAARDVSKDIAAAGVTLEEQGETLNMRARSATSVTEAAASELSRHSQNLAKSVRDAESAVERIASVRQDAQQDAFMDSAKFIVESLHSLSVDISRQLSGDIDDKTWKAFKKGDVSAFTKRLVELDLDKVGAKVKAKYEDDNSFRTYVMRFIRQFEEIIESAGKTSHADMLIAAFISSDLGKLYSVLCSVAGKQSKIAIH